MAFKDFSEYQYERDMDTGEIIKMGSLKVGEAVQLLYMRIMMAIHGVFSGTEQVRVNIYADEGQSKKMFSSSWSNLNTIVNASDSVISGNWIGMLRMDFDRQNLNPNIRYYAGVESQNYVASFDTFYISFCHDYPFPRYATGAGIYYETNLAFEIFGERE